MSELQIELNQNHKEIKKNPLDFSESKDTANHEKKNVFLEKIKEKLPFWKKKVLIEPDEVIEDISKIGEVSNLSQKENENEVSLENNNNLERNWQQDNTGEGVFKLETDKVLDLYSEYIQEMDVPDIDEKNHVLDKLINKVFSDESLDENVITINPTEYNPDDPLVANLPEYIRENMIKIYHNTNHKEHDDIEIQQDPRLIRMWNLVDLYYKKNIELLERDGLANKKQYGDNELFPENLNPTYAELMNRKRVEFFNAYPIANEVLYEKRIEGTIISPDTFIGHGSYLSNFVQMLDGGGILKSPWFAESSGSHPESGIRTLGVDPGAIFFFSDKKRDGGIGMYADLRRRGQLGIIFREAEILEKGLILGTKNGTNSESEVFVTSTPNLFEANELTPDERHDLALKDKTALDIRDGFIRVYDRSSYDGTILALKSHGFSDEWIGEHVTLLDINATQKDVDRWLQSRKMRPIPENLKERKYVPEKGWKNNYFVWKQLNE